jgi:hypothetical protein
VIEYQFIQVAQEAVALITQRIPAVDQLAVHLYLLAEEHLLLP